MKISSFEGIAFLNIQTRNAPRRYSVSECLFHIVSLKSIVLMKSFLQKKSVQLLSLTMLFSLLVGVNALHAQNVGPALPDGQINWVSPSMAMDRLTQSMADLEQQVQMAGQSSPLVYKLKYYTAVFYSIEEGVPVPTAVDANYGRFVPGVVDIPVEYPNSIPVSTWAAYRQELTELLQN